VGTACEAPPTPLGVVELCSGTVVSLSVVLSKHSIRVDARELLHGVSLLNNIAQAPHRSNLLIVVIWGRSSSTTDRLTTVPLQSSAAAMGGRSFTRCIFLYKIGKEFQKMKFRNIFAK